MEDGNNKRRESDHSTQAKVNDSPTVFGQVEDFIKRFHDGDISIAPEANTLQFKIPAGAFMGTTSNEIRSYADILGWAIGAYQYYKDNPHLVGKRQECAYHLLDLIERGRAFGIIKNLNLTNRVKTLELENSQLKEQLANLKLLNAQLAKQNEDLHKYFPDADKRSGEVGDVEER